MADSDPTSTTCVLVVDDDEDVRDAIQDAVEAAGCCAVVAPNGAEAMRVLGDKRPCLIVLDLWMPVMNGLQVLQRLKANAELATIPVVVSTSAPKDAPRDVPLLPKPIDLKALLRLIDQHCTCNAVSS